MWGGNSTNCNICSVTDFAIYVGQVSESVLCAVKSKCNICGSRDRCGVYATKNQPRRGVSAGSVNHHNKAKIDKYSLHIVVKYAVTLVCKASCLSRHCDRSRALGKASEEAVHDECAEDKAEEVYAHKHSVRHH